MITGFYAGLLAIVFLVLSARVIAYRIHAKISLGEGEDKNMRRRIRAQANFVEYAPFGVLLLLLMELQNASPLLLHLCGVMLLAGRILHGIALSGTSQWMLGRRVGMILTLTTLALAACATLYLSVI